MIKVEVERMEGGVARLRFKTNNEEVDRDDMDFIGNLILCTNPKRGSYEKSDMVIDVKSNDKE